MRHLAQLCGPSHFSIGGQQAISLLLEPSLFQIGRKGSGKSRQRTHIRIFEVPLRIAREDIDLPQEATLCAHRRR